MWGKKIHIFPSACTKRLMVILRLYKICIYLGIRYCYYIIFIYDFFFKNDAKTSIVPVKLSQYYIFEKRLYIKNDRLRYLFHVITLYGLFERNKNKLYGNLTATSGVCTY